MWACVWMSVSTSMQVSVYMCVCVWSCEWTWVCKYGHRCECINMSVPCVSVSTCVSVYKAKAGRHFCMPSIGPRLSGYLPRAEPPTPCPLICFCPLSLVRHPPALAGITWCLSSHTPSSLCLTCSQPRYISMTHLLNVTICLQFYWRPLSLSDNDIIIVITFVCYRSHYSESFKRAETWPRLLMAASRNHHCSWHTADNKRLSN